MLDAKVVELRDDFSKRTAEAEALKVLSREQLDTLIQHGKDRIAAGAHGPPPKKMQKA